MKLRTIVVKPLENGLTAEVCWTDVRDGEHDYIEKEYVFTSSQTLIRELRRLLAPWAKQYKKVEAPF